MTDLFRYLLLLLLLLSPNWLPAEQRPEIVGNPPKRENFSVPELRSKRVNELARIERREKADAIALARKLDLPIRLESATGRVQELMAFKNGKPLYATTLNREAAITTAATSTRALFGVDGNGFTIGIWDAGSVRATHEAFGNRVLVKDDVSLHNHATHVAGTIGAGGNNIRAHGMSPAVRIDSYDWNNDRSELAARGASYPGEPETIYLSNHSYGYISGWDRSSANSNWIWHGAGSTASAVEINFGRYNNYAHEIDALLFDIPYLLPFWAAGNDRDQNPEPASSVRIDGQIFSYNSAQHPPGDGVYKNGYDTISFEAVAKNVMTVGAVSDAVTAGHRDLSKATSSTFSAWGPTDDGRIKPDIVANGVGLYSTQSQSDTSYGNSTGTSMATANATGSAQLLVSYFDELFPGHAMRASTLKALIIHTADDLGPPGPDYTYGWGLLNTEKAVRQIEAYSANPGGYGIVEAELFQTPNENVHTYPFLWDGISPIRATLAWTDPPANATSTHDNRSSRLVNDLDLHIVGPNDQIHEPYVMPYVGDWSENSLSTPATTGVNSTDNVEQVFISSPTTPGTYIAVVSTSKPLTNGSQIYSLILSGSGSINAPPPKITAISPESASEDRTIFTLSGSDFQIGAEVRFEFPDEIPRPAFGHEITTNRITARIETDEMKNGFWDVAVKNPDGQETLLPSAFAVGNTIWHENFDALTEPWEIEATTDTSTWTIASGSSASPPFSYHGTGLQSKGIDDLYSPVIPIPETADDLELTFQHRFSFSFNQGGMVEFSLNGGPWFDLDSPNSGVEFRSGDYNNAFPENLPPPLRNPLAPRRNWSGDVPAFSNVLIALDRSIYAGQNLRIRWRLATDGFPTSAGWWIDNVSLKGSAATILPIPKITSAPSATPTIVSGKTAQLSVVAENPDHSPLLYTWHANDRLPALVQFSQNNDENAATTEVTFPAAGPYLFDVIVR
ncbi:MAG TPA: S8 family serine peptidase, partial [Opitutales bacterium]|nr:S8 family serine peptidase [Opitutales bacterium]